MKAWVLYGVNDLRLEDVNIPVLKENEVLVEVKATGICGSDIARVYTTGAHVHPIIPGHEFSGIVKEVGCDVDKNWVGKKVGVFPLIPCKKCLMCKEEHYELCRNYDYLGSRRDGGFVEYAVVPKENLLVLPDEVDIEEAAMLEPMAVAVHAIRRVDVKENDTVVVYGLGTIGLFVTMFLVEAGVENIFIIGNKDFQKQSALLLGVKEKSYCDSRKQDVAKWIKESTNGIGPNVFFECVGKNVIVEEAINVTSPMGRICLVGNPYSDIELKKDIYWKILRNQLIITGTWNSTFLHKEKDDWNYVIKCLVEKKIMPKKFISHRYPLNKLEKGLEIMKDKTEDYIKIMLVEAE